MEARKHTRKISGRLLKILTTAETEREQEDQISLDDEAELLPDPREEQAEEAISRGDITRRKGSREVASSE